LPTKTSDRFRKRYSILYSDLIQQAVQLAARGEQPSCGRAAAGGRGIEGDEIPGGAYFLVEAQRKHGEEQPLPRQDIRDESFEIKEGVSCVI